jgi:hypothetical protein
MTKATTLTSATIESAIAEYHALIKGMGSHIDGMRGIELFKALKRTVVTDGPHPGVSLFEAANRIMSDLVIYYGVRGLLRGSRFPYKSYTVDLGHTDTQTFDLRAETGGRTLVGEACNVASSFFATKRLAMSKKLRRLGGSAVDRLVMYNHDAVTRGYRPRLQQGEAHVQVNIGDGSVTIFPDKP